MGKLSRRDYLGLTGSVLFGVNQFDVYNKKEKKEIHEYITPEAPIVEDIAKDTVVPGLNYAVNLPQNLEFKPESEKVDQWLTPEEYWENNLKGDCEDYAFFTTSVLIAKSFEKEDLEAYTVFGDIKIEGESGDHALTQLNYPGQKYVMDVNLPGITMPLSEFKGLYDWEPYRKADHLETTEY